MNPIIVGLVVVVIFLILYKAREHAGQIGIRRWRPAPPPRRSFVDPLGQTVYVEPRQIADTWWDQNYNSGIGFQLA